MERKELNLYNFHSGGSNDKSLLEILSDNDKIIGDKVIDMNSDDIRKFRVIKKKLLTTVAENKRLEKEVRSKTNGEGKKEKKQINPDDFGKPKSLQDI
jgi:hypothetical protein